MELGTPRSKGYTNRFVSVKLNYISFRYLSLEFRDGNTDGRREQKE